MRNRIGRDGFWCVDDRLLTTWGNSTAYKSFLTIRWRYGTSSPIFDRSDSRRFRTPSWGWCPNICVVRSTASISRRITTWKPSNYNKKYNLAWQHRWSKQSSRLKWTRCSVERARWYRGRRFVANFDFQNRIETGRFQPGADYGTTPSFDRRHWETRYSVSICRQFIPLSGIKNGLLFICRSIQGLGESRWELDTCSGHKCTNSLRLSSFHHWGGKIDKIDFRVGIPEQSKAPRILWPMKAGRVLGPFTRAGRVSKKTGREQRMPRRRIAKIQNNEGLLSRIKDFTRQRQVTASTEFFFNLWRLLLLATTVWTRPMRLSHTWQLWYIVQKGWNFYTRLIKVLRKGISLTANYEHKNRWNKQVFP
jgi:hypothetical protein